MNRHIIDRPRKRNKSGMKMAFARIEGKQMPRRETLELQRRPTDRDAAMRLREFLRIERGIEV
ncbi:MAG: hypothetical protein KDA73_10280 [Rhodobacteraceae bacterium]|nr:hypothetical protein [Paracoccaceae bacterium]